MARLWIPLVLLALTGVGLAFDEPNAQAGAFVQIAGVCNPDPYGIKCFDPSGKVDAKLTGDIREFFLNHPETPLRLIYGHRDKLIVVRESVEPLYAGYKFKTLLKDDGTSFPASIDVPVRPNDAIQTHLYWYYPPASEVQIPMRMVTQAKAPYESTELKIGATIAVKGHRWSISFIGPLSEETRLPDNLMKEPWILDPSRQLWEIRFKPTTMGDLPFSGTDAYMLDQDGVYIQTVDRAGRPDPTDADSPEQGELLTWGVAGGLVTWINPKYAKQIRIRLILTNEYRFPSVHLGPY